jgi:polyisoprenoid-binding protein YceI
MTFTWGHKTMITIRHLSAALAACALGLGLVSTASAACPPGLPKGIVCGVPDAKLAPGGAYAIDPSHTAVIARVSHIGYSLSIFRFGDVKADLMWDPAQASHSTLKVAVQTASIATPVPDFATELAGPQYLDSKDFPEATFVSTTFHQISPTKGKVDGIFTLKGKSKPVTLDVELVGAGPGFGSPRIGVHASGWIDPRDFNMGPFFQVPIELTIDAEFVKTPPAKAG